MRLPLSGGLAAVSPTITPSMAYTRRTSKAAAATPVSTGTAEPVFHALGAIFETASESTPFVGMADEVLLQALNLEQPPQGKEWKIFARARTSRAGKPYISLYLGLSDLRR